MCVNDGLAGFNIDEPAKWKPYKTKLFFYFATKKISDKDIQRATLLHRRGDTLLDLVIALVSPRDVTTVPYDDIVAVLDKHFAPRVNKTVAVFNFRLRYQQVGETASTYVGELRRLASNCDFGTFLDRMLCDQLVLRVKDQLAQKTLLVKVDLSLQTALEIVTTTENSTQHLLEVRAGASERT